MTIMIREMTPQDWQRVATIYGEGIETRLATFQTEVPSWETWDSGHIQACRLVACDAAEPQPCYVNS